MYCTRRSSGKSLRKIRRTEEIKRKKKQQQVAAPSPFLAAEKVTDKQSPAGDRLVVPSTEEEIPLTDIEFDNAAELRKAVIYTEILNRKY